MRTVHKYAIGDDTTVNMPRGAQLMSVAMQRGEPQLWAMVETTQPLEQRRFCIFGTGQGVIERPVAYVGTLHFDGLVFHAFEMKA